MAGVADCMNGSGIRSLTALYVAAPFSMGYVDFYTFLMPLFSFSITPPLVPFPAPIFSPGSCFPARRRASHDVHAP